MKAIKGGSANYFQKLLTRVALPPSEAGAGSLRQPASGSTIKVRTNLEPLKSVCIATLSHLSLQMCIFPLAHLSPSHASCAPQLSPLLTLSSPPVEPHLFHIPFAQVCRLRQTYLTRGWQAGRWMWQLWKRG